MATISSTSIAKAGWLYRETSLLHRWKRNWFVLYVDGILRFFDSPSSSIAESHVVLKNECIEVSSAKLDMMPPEGMDRRGLFTLVFLKEGTWNLCAENEDDMRAWTYTINEMRQGGPLRGGQAPVSYPTTAGYVPAQPMMYPGQTAAYPPVYNAPTTVVMPSGLPPQTVVYATDPLFGHHGYSHHHHGFGLHSYGHHGYGSGLYLSGGISSPFAPSYASGGAVLGTPGTTHHVTHHTSHHHGHHGHHF